MIAAGRERHRAGLMHLAEKILDPDDGVVDVDRIDADIADIGNSAQLIRANAERMVGAAHETRHIADFTRAVARTGAVGGAAVPRHTGERDIDRIEISYVRQAHKGWHATKARHFHAVHRLVKLAFLGHHVPLWLLPARVFHMIRPNYRWASKN